MERSVQHAVFGDRRDFLKLVGAGTAAAALAEVFPMGAAKALAQEKPGPLEKKDLKVGFIPITCATPIIMAEPMGFYKKYGLNVQVVKASSWAMIRDLSINEETDATHMLSPMPLASAWASARRRCRTSCRPSRTSTARRSRSPTSTRASRARRT